MVPDALAVGLVSQEDLNDYIRKLPSKERCRFMAERAVPLCTNTLICPYKGKDTYPYQGERVRECRREEILRQKRILGERI